MGMTVYLKPLSESELNQIRSEPAAIEDILFPEDDDDPFEGQTDLEKSWHALHFLLTGKVGPDGTAIGDAVLGGEEVGPDLGYGRARIVEAERVKEIAAALAAVDFSGAFDAVDRTSSDLAEIYLCNQFAESERSYLEHYFKHLLAGYTQAAQNSMAMLVYPA